MSVDRRLSRTAFALFLLTFAACQARPIPLTVAAGSTMFLPVAAGAFGSELARATDVPSGTARPDYQRGDLVVVLCPTSAGDSACTNAGTTRYYLTTRYVTSVAPDPASPAGLRGYLNAFSSSIGGTGYPLWSQEVAILEVPTNVPSADYYMSVRTRPVGSAQGVNETPAFSQPGVIHVNPLAPSGFGLTDPNNMNYGPNSNPLPIYISQDLQDLIPYPTFVVRLTTENNPNIWPAAANIELTYNPSLIRIKGAYEDRHLGRRSIVQTADASGVLKISFVDPERCTTGIRVAYDLVGTTPVTPAVLTVNAANTRSYDLNGAPLTGNPFLVSTISNAPANACGPH